MKYALDNEYMVLLQKKLEVIENNIQKIVSDIAVTDKTSNVYWTKINRDIRLEYSKMQSVFNSWINRYMPLAYNNNVKDFVNHIRGLKTKTAKISAKDIINSTRSKRSLSQLIYESSNSFGIGLSTGQKTFNQLTQLTKQTLMNEQDDVKLSSVERNQKALLKKAIDGKYITVIDKNGKPINYKPRYYAELIARTKTREAQSISTINSALEYNTDLVQVSSHNTNTPICLEYEGKVFSITGEDKDFPTIDQFPPFHINCLHSITPIFKEVIERRGIDKYKDFSSGKTEIHPTRRSHIPISERAK